VALSGQIVDLIRFNLADKRGKPGAIREVTVVQEEFGLGIMRVDI
jgi:hypothetical protein